jgi:hypothetical protein
VALQEVVAVSLGAGQPGLVCVAHGLGDQT